jgi:hypothetical protein
MKTCAAETVRQVRLCLQRRASAADARVHARQARYAAVLANPLFQADPVAAVCNHVLAQMPPPAARAPPSKKPSGGKPPPHAAAAAAPHARMAHAGSRGKKKPQRK